MAFVAKPSLTVISIGSGEGLTPYKLQAITHINDDVVHWRIYGSRVLSAYHD